jgi:hypothetical protein
MRAFAIITRAINVCAATPTTAGFKEKKKKTNMS